MGDIKRWKTPHGGDYTILYTLDDNGNEVSEDECTRMILHECKDDGTIVHEVISRGRKK